MYSRIHEPHACTLTDALREWAASCPGAPWLEDSQGSAFTVGQALTNSQRFASFLHHQLGVQPEERVGVFMSNSCAMVATTFGIGYLRATAVMLNTELRSAFLRHQLNDSQLSTVVVDSALVEHIASLADELSHLPTLVVVGDAPATLPERWRQVAWTDSSACAPWEGPAPRSEDIFCIMYTSGTTGPSKGVLMPHCHCALLGLGGYAAWRSPRPKSTTSACPCSMPTACSCSWGRRCWRAYRPSSSSGSAPAPGWLTFDAAAPR
ncbi:AMP-binding protein [Xylophilus sp. ASV27]|uniref:AMP-binding protein n=1 Tax=Xylophilus sp. ASV27 TaxID=2795129 RepID=UPI00351CA124